MNRIMIVSRAALLAAALYILAQVAPANPPEGNWTEDVNQGLGQAKAQGKPALLMFSASWCGPCNRMKKEVFTQDRVKERLRQWVTVYIDGDKHRELMEKYHAEAYPTFVVLTPDGKETGRFVGGVGPDTFLDNLRILQTELPRLERQLTAAPKDPALWKKRGQLLEDLGSIPEAVEAYKKALTLDPQNKTGVAADVAFFNAAQVSENATNADMDKRFSDFIKRHPGSPRVEDATFNRARIAFDDKRFDDVKALLNQYLQQYPKGKYVREARGILDYLAKGGPNQKQGGRTRNAQ